MPKEVKKARPRRAAAAARPDPGPDLSIFNYLPPRQIGRNHYLCIDNNHQTQPILSFTAINQMKKIATLLAAALTLGLGATSCLSDPKSSQENTYTYGASSAFNRVVDRETGEATISINPNYKMVYSIENYSDKGQVSVDMSNIQLGISGLTFRLNSLPFSYDPMTASYVTTATDITPAVNPGGYVFDKFEMKNILGRVIENQLAPVFTIRFSVNDRYDVTVMPAEVILVGNIHAVSRNAETDNKGYDTKNSIISIKVNTVKMLADVLIARAQFSQSMPQTDLLATELPVTTNNDGYTISLPEGKDKVPLKYNNNKEMEDCWLSGFSLSYNIPTGATTLKGTYTLKGRGTDADKTEVYDVDADAGYLFKVEETDKTGK